MSFRLPPRPRMLVTYASAHGSTREIAATLARRLAGAGSVVLRPVQERPDPSAFDVVVLGSALYDGRWLAPARLYATAFGGALSARPLWVFSSGVPGPWRPVVRQDGERVVRALGARGHRRLPGRLERRLLPVHERAALHGPACSEGDRRDQGLTGRWADEIIEELTSTRVPAAAD